MRTNIDIDDAVMEAAMKAGTYQTKKDAVEAGLKLIARQAAYREILRWEGKLHWNAESDAEPDAAAGPSSQGDGAVTVVDGFYDLKPAPPLTSSDQPTSGGAAHQPGPAESRELASSRRRRAGR